RVGDDAFSVLDHVIHARPRLLHLRMPVFRQMPRGARFLRAERRTDIVNLLMARTRASAYSCHDWVRWAFRPKYSSSNSVEPPSLPEGVIIGGWTSQNPWSRKYSWTAPNAVCRIRKIVVIRWERTHRWRTSSRNSSLRSS